MTQGASRNFRNIWYHYPDGFAEFRKTIQETWPGMDIEKPEVDHSNGEAILHMFCPEERFPREIYWAGFGFQVWCQMVTFILQARQASTLVIDEPDIYLHSDLQRQLVEFLQALGPQVILATHSVEIISEVESNALLNVNKRFRSARPVKDTHELQSIFQVLGSNLNPTLTQLAKTRRAVFVEGKDYQMLSRFARQLGLASVANRSDFAVIPVEGFNPQKVKDFALGMEMTLGAKLLKVAIFDRDYRSDGEVAVITKDLEQFCWFAVVHDRKELENFLLNPQAINRAISKRLAERNPQQNSVQPVIDSKSLLMQLSNGMKNQVQARLVSSRQKFERSAHSSLDQVTVSEDAMNEFDAKWDNFEHRMRLVPGKELFANLNDHVQKACKISLSPFIVIDSFSRSELSDFLANIPNSNGRTAVD